jgi:hypothetical protein
MPKKDKKSSLGFEAQNFNDLEEQGTEPSSPIEEIRDDLIPPKVPENGVLTPLKKLSKDLKLAAMTLNEKEARYLVDMYYQIQEYRKATANQDKAMTTSEEPHEVLLWFMSNTIELENQIKTILDAYTKNHPVGVWLQSITGIGPVISAGLLANIDITMSPTAGHIWSFAGIDPNRIWHGAERAREIVNEVILDIVGEKEFKKKGGVIITDEIFEAVAAKSGWSVEFLKKHSVDSKKKKVTKEQFIKAVSMRPWNARLKTLVWKIGQSFVKVSNNANDTYGKIYQQRKTYEIAKNDAGDYADQARMKLEKCKIGKDTEAYKYYIIGKLPPGHIQQRCERYAAKIFLSHLQDVWYKHHYKTDPPKPFALAILGHAHMIEIPNTHLMM